MKLSAIVAVSVNGIIGQGNTIPWTCKADRDFFKEMTKNHVVITGFNTFFTMPNKNFKHTIVLTSNECRAAALNLMYRGVPVTFVCSMEEAYETAGKISPHTEVFVVGGAQVYELFADYYDHAYVTMINVEVHGEDLISLAPIFTGYEAQEILELGHDANDTVTGQLAILTNVAKKKRIEEEAAKTKAEAEADARQKAEEEQAEQRRRFLIEESAKMAPRGFLPIATHELRVNDLLAANNRLVDERRNRDAIISLNKLTIAELEKAIQTLTSKIRDLEEHIADLED